MANNIVKVEKTFEEYLGLKSKVIALDPMIDVHIKIDFVDDKCTLVINGVNDITEQEKKSCLDILTKGIDAIREYLLDY